MLFVILAATINSRFVKEKQYQSQELFGFLALLLFSFISLQIPALSLLGFINHKKPFFLILLIKGLITKK
jgi:hypothetical protein